MSLNNAKVIAESQKLSPSALLELIEIDATALGVPEVIRFYAGTNHLDANVVFQGKVYSAFPIEITGFESKVRGELPRPILRLANVAGILTAAIADFNDLLGAKVIRRRTFARYLDTQPGSNEVNPDADPTAEYPPDIYYIERKSGENKLSVDFELATALDLDGVKLPRRIIVGNTCAWTYRSPSCGFAGEYAVADSLNRPAPSTLVWRGVYNPTTVYLYGNGVYIQVGDARVVYVYIGSVPKAGVPLSNKSFWFEDVCSHALSGCRKRFDPNNLNKPLPFGAFPGTANLSSI